MIEAIRAVWDGDETWLILAGITLWAAFPDRLKQLAAGVLLARPRMLAALGLRGVSFEFRDESTPPSLRCGTRSSGSDRWVRASSRHRARRALGRCPHQQGSNGNVVRVRRRTTRLPYAGKRPVRTGARFPRTAFSVAVGWRPQTVRLAQQRSENACIARTRRRSRCSRWCRILAALSRTRPCERRRRSVRT